VNSLSRLVYLISGTIVVLLSLVLINQISPFNFADHSDQTDLNTEQIAENEAAENSVESENEENDGKEASGSSTVPTGGSGFKHEVQMDIDGVVEENQDEGWWKID
jgi:hypothetical protein